MGVHYMVEGIRLLWHPRLRKYILVPLLVNCILFVALTSLILGYYWALVDGSASLIPDWLSPWLAPLKWIAWFIVGTLFLIVYGYSFNLITNFIAAPFYGFLASETEKLITGKSPPDESLGKMLARVFSREISKLLYFFGRGLLVILLMILVSLIPLLNFAAPIIGLIWAAWSMSIQYADYAADNHQVPFPAMRDCLWLRKRSSLGFGGCIMACSVIPIVNIFAMPAAVTGGTLFWLNEIRELGETEHDETVK